MKVLVTGGGGFCGSVLTRHLTAAGHSVVVYDIFQHGIDSILSASGSVECIRGDVRDDQALGQAGKDCDAIIHLAAIVGYPACRENPVVAYDTIVRGTLAASQLATARKIPLIHASTGSVYGKVENLCTEDSPCNPVSEYGKYKLAAEQIVRDDGGINLRLATLCGVSPCMRFDLLPNDFIWRAIKQGYIVIYCGNDRRTFLSVDDAARAYIATLNVAEAIRGETFNVGSEEFNLTKLDLARRIQQQFPFELVEQPVGSDPDLRDYAVNFRRFHAATGFIPQDTLGQVIAAIGRVVKVCPSVGQWRRAM
jgi:nucleoside-diphosphate-sugar epimerase